MNGMSMMAKGGKIGLILEKEILIKPRYPLARDMRKAIKICTHRSI